MLNDLVSRANGTLQSLTKPRNGWHPSNLVISTSGQAMTEKLTSMWCVQCLLGRLIVLRSHFEVSAQKCYSKTFTKKTATAP